MTAWWASLSVAQNIFYSIALAATLVLVLQLLMNLIGLAGHDDADATIVVDHGDVDGHSTGLALISIRTVVAFFVGFGWGGVVLLSHAQSMAMVILGAAVAGTACLLLVFYLLKSLLKLGESGNVDNRNALGSNGTVYIPIPAAGKGHGQVQIAIQGRLREVTAITEGPDELPTGTAVKVVKVIGETTLVVNKVEI